MHGPVKRHHIDARTEQVTAALERIAKDDDTLFSTKELAALFGVTVTWCKIRRMRGEGPDWIALAPRCIRYRKRDIVKWLDTRKRLHSKRRAGKAA